MTKRIPRNLIEHLGWRPNQTPPPPPTPTPSPPRPPSTQKAFTIERLIQEGKEFFNQDKDAAEKWIGLPLALTQAQEYATPQGNVASMPQLLAGKATAEKTNYLWKNWFTALSEEHVGLDQQKHYGRARKPIVLLIHGGGILTPERIFQAYTEGLTPQNAARFKQEEWDNLLKGTLPNGESIQIYNLEDVRKAKIPDPFGRYGVAVDFELAKSLATGYHDKTTFMNAPLVQARAGTLEYLEKYFDKAVTRGTVGNHHKLAVIDPQQPQGRVLFILNISDGLDGDSDLDDSGRFVGVAPEARGKKK